MNKAKKLTKLILAIESSADETAAAVLEFSDYKKPARQSLAKDGWPQIKVLSSAVKSQIDIHKKFGGIVPETAARAHIKNVLPVVEKALLSTNYQLSSIDYIAVTQGPGLIPSLIVGVEFGKALALATGKPMVAVNHMAGHLYSPFGENREQKTENRNIFPMISLIVSGGHTMIVLMKDEKEYKVLGQTVDDAAGEAFDKVAKLLKLPYPGGPEVSMLAEKAKHPVEFPRPMINSKDYNFSFSGLKTAVLYYVKDKGLKIKDPALKADICAGFQNAAVNVLVTKTMRAAKEFNAKSVSLSGGVAANQKLRQELIVNCQKLGVKFMAPPVNLCTDNAEMIGIAAAFMLHNGYKPVNYKKVIADSNLEL